MMDTKSDIKRKIEASFRRAELSDFFKIIETEPNKFIWFIWTFKITKGQEIKPVGIARNNLRRLTHHLGFRRLTSEKEVVFKDGQIISLSSIEEIKSTIFDLLNLFDEKEVVSCDGITDEITSELLIEIFLRQQHLAINKTSLIDYLTELDGDILQDTPDTSYIPFQNGIVTITNSDVQLVPYEQISKLVWKERLLPHNFEFLDYSNFMVTRFMFNVSGKDHKRVSSLMSIFGYLMHNHFPMSENRAVILVDEEAAHSNAPEGGSGKGLSAQMLAQVRRLVVLDGKRFLKDNRFLFQQVRADHQIVHLDDVKNNFDTVSLNSVLSDGLAAERKGKDVVKIPKERTPKFLISANAGISSEGTTRKRRQIIFPFSNHYSQLIRKGVHDPIVHEHGQRFFDSSWSETDWQMFFTLMTDCIKIYLSEGLIELDNNQVKTIGLKAVTNLEFVDFVEKHVQLNVRTQTKESYQSFLQQYDFEITEFKQRTFSNWLKKYAGVYGYEYTNETDNGISYFTIKN
ncbi:MAG: hypothetical protein ABJ004_03395 [Cyclobacteriaceae bacterium]